ncbi:NAD(P)-binding domain protein [Niveomyces insectorum RCEF 264]|uniref:NAD(P)-binding domain protein n=1 Tax=Niveomyces insectorum RCEF 264 TaxID=1081102 RepID=A0A167UXF5_9HYPO|nr:NAD(P)-binding domain protein [Niveomyces insectorum RCEF 264]
METDPRTALPADIAPVSAKTRKMNEFRAGTIFPFKTWQSLPSFSTAVLNISLSAGTLLVGAGGLVLTVVVFLPVGILKSVGGRVGARIQKAPKPAKSADAKRRCIVITGARTPSSGIGAALALEYAAPDAHLILIARDETRLKDVAAQASQRGATASVHSIDLSELDGVAELDNLLEKADAQADGIDIAISCAGITSHHTGVLDRKGMHDSPRDDVSQPPPPDGIPGQGDDAWGVDTASQMLQVNVAANQAFVLRSWELMKARQLRGSRPATARPGPKIIVLSSSTAFFLPATFALYAASKAYLYTLARSLQIASVPYGIGVVAVTPGFVETGMTATVRAAGARLPAAVLGDPRTLARKIRRSGEENELLVFYPTFQVWSLFVLRGLNPLLETFGMWAAASMGVAAWFFS